MSDDLPITDTVSIPAGELSFTASRSSGPGGQHVNKVSSRVTLHFDVASSRALDDDQKRRIMTRLRTRINRDGVMRLHVQRHRSQSANRIEAAERLVALLREALARRRPRKKTRKPAAANRKRLEQKRRRGVLKAGRGKPSPDD